jgi:hypothetical protein
MGQLFSSTEMRSRVGRWVRGVTAVSVLLGLGSIAVEPAAASGAPKNADDPGETTWGTDFQANWDRAVDEIFSPLQNSGLAVLGMIAGLLVLARLLVFTRGGLTFSARKNRRQMGVLGLALVILSPLTLVTLAGAGLRPWWTWIPFLLLTGCGGSWAISRYLGSRLALRITTTGAKDEKGRDIQVQPSEVIAHLTQLGAAPPEGIEVSASTDVTALKDIVSPALPKHPAVSIVVGILEGFIGLTPWRVTLESVTATKATITVARNGRSITAEKIDVTALKIPQSNTGTHVPELAAAVVLTSLSKYHRGFEALCGATKWESVGLQYVASTVFAEDKYKVQREQLLRAAVDSDHRNLPAQVALQHSRHRTATSTEELARYLNWLATESKMIRRLHAPGGGYTDIHRRLLVTYFAALRNLIAVAGQDEARTLVSDERRAKLAHRLVNLLNDERSPELRDRMRYQVEPLLRDLPLRNDTHRIMRSWAIDYATERHSPDLAYNLACANVRNLNGADPDDATYDLLKRSFVVDFFREWAAKDPELKALHPKAEFRKLVGKWPRASFWELELFTAHRARLTSAGVYEPRDIAAVFSSVDLSNYLSVPLSVAERMRRTSALVLAAESTIRPAGPYELRIEIVDRLLSLGVSSPTDYTWFLRDAAGKSLATAISSTLQERTWRVSSPRKLKCWLRRLRAATPRA